MLVRTSAHLYESTAFRKERGDRWGNPGLIKSAAKLGKDAGPVIKALKTGLPVLPERRDAADAKDRPQYDEIIAGVTKAIADYEKLSE